MKIAYLMHYMKNNFEEITENLDILINQGDDVYLMVNDDDLRDDLILSYCDTPNLHVAHHQQTALPADMSLPRGFIVLMKDALEFEKEYGSFTYDRFIIMTDGMIPTKSKAQLVEYLETHEDEDIYYEVDNSDENVEVKKRFENYAFFTNSYDFQKSKTIRAMNKMTSSLVHSFKKREIEDTIYISYPWFILTHESAKALADNLLLFRQDGKEGAAGGNRQSQICYNLSGAARQLPWKGSLSFCCGGGYSPSGAVQRSWVSME